MNHDETPNGFGRVGRRGVLAAGGAAATLAGLGWASPAMAGERPSRRLERLARTFFAAIESRNPATIWALCVPAPSIEFPLVGFTVTDFPTFDASFAPLFAVLDGLRFSGFVFEAMANDDEILASYRGHATVTYNGKAYDQRYVTMIRFRGDKVVRYREHYDTAALAEALAP